MAQPRRIVPNKNQKLKADAKSRRSKVVVTSVLVSAAVVVTLVAIPFSSAPAARPAPAPPGDRAAQAAWVEIVSELKETVPARILLGGSGSSPALDARLKANRIDRANFQRAAAALRREVARETDDDAREAIAMSAQNFPLPDGFEITQDAPDPSPEPASSSESARSLVLELAARLVRPDDGTEDL